MSVNTIGGQKDSTPPPSAHADPTYIYPPPLASACMSTY